MNAAARWRKIGWLRWSAIYLALVALAILVGTLTVGVGDAMFVAGAILILVSVGFIGAGGKTRFKPVRDRFGVPVALEKVDPRTREREISTGVKLFLLGLALWAPLLVLAWRS